MLMLHGNHHTVIVVVVVVVVIVFLLLYGDRKRHNILSSHNVRPIRSTSDVSNERK